MLTTHEEISSSFGQKPHIMKKLIRESGTPYDVRNGMYILDGGIFEEKYKMMMVSAAEKRAQKKAKAKANKKKKQKASPAAKAK